MAMGRSVGTDKIGVMGGGGGGGGDAIGDELARGLVSVREGRVYTYNGQCRVAGGTGEVSETG